MVPQLALRLPYRSIRNPIQAGREGGPRPETLLTAQSLILGDASLSLILSLFYYLWGTHWRRILCGERHGDAAGSPAGPTVGT